MARRLPAVIAEHPDLIIWQTGSNDPLRDVPLDRFVQETIAGVQAIRAAHIDVMLMGPQLCQRAGPQAHHACAIATRCGPSAKAWMCR